MPNDFIETPAPIPESKPIAVLKEEEQGNILKVTREEQYKTVSELFERAQPNSIYYSLLVLSVFIVVCGLLLNNSPIVIGGMLVTPVLTPILVIALGITVGELKSIKAPGILILKSILITILVSGALTLAFGIQEVPQILENSLRTALLYFIVASTSGMAATFAWVRKQVAEILPGISIAVSLVPPLSLIGIEMGALDFEAARFYLLIFVLNFVGILIGSIIVFSLLRFQRSGWEVKKKVKEGEEIQAYKEAEKKAEKIGKKMEQIKKNIEEVEKVEKEKGL